MTSARLCDAPGCTCPATWRLSLPRGLPVFACSGDACRASLSVANLAPGHAGGRYITLSEEGFTADGTIDPRVGVERLAFSTRCVECMEVAVVDEDDLCATCAAAFKRKEALYDGNGGKNS